MLHKDPAVKNKWEQKIQKAKDSTDENSNVQCAITGEYAPIARIHNKIKKVFTADRHQGRAGNFQ